MEPTVSPLSVIDDVTCDQRKRVVVVRKSFEARRIQSAHTVAMWATNHRRLEQNLKECARLKPMHSL